VRDPKGMLERHTGQKLPAQVKIFIHEEDANTLHLSIPPAPGNLTELSGEQLEKVAGGTEFVVVSFAVTARVASFISAAGATVKEAGW
jgi:hypothetical protein